MVQAVPTSQSATQGVSGARPAMQTDGEEIAQLRGLRYEDVVDATTENFFRLFPEARTKVAQ